MCRHPGRTISGGERSCARLHSAGGVVLVCLHPPEYPGRPACRVRQTSGRLSRGKACTVLFRTCVLIVHFNNTRLLCNRLAAVLGRSYTAARAHTGPHGSDLFTLQTHVTTWGDRNQITKICLRFGFTRFLPAHSSSDPHGNPRLFRTASTLHTTAKCEGEHVQLNVQHG